MSTKNRVYTKRKARLPKPRSYHFYLYQQNMANLVYIQEAKLMPSAAQVVRFCLDTVARLVQVVEAGGKIRIETKDGMELLDLGGCDKSEQK